MLLGLAYQAGNCFCASLQQLPISSYNDTPEKQIKSWSAQYQSFSLNQKNIFLLRSQLLAPRKAGKCFPCPSEAFPCRNGFDGCMKRIPSALGMVEGAV